MIELRLKKHNTSERWPPVWAWKIQYRRIPGRTRWCDYISFGRLMLFDNTDKAVEYARQIRYPGVMKSGELARIQAVKTKQNELNTKN